MAEGEVAEVHKVSQSNRSRFTLAYEFDSADLRMPPPRPRSFPMLNPEYQLLRLIIRT
jgi:hypothetical protein